MASHGSMITHYRLLKAIRLANDLSQEQMAVLAGVSRRSITTMESGGDTTLKTLRAVQHALEEKGIRFLPEANGSGHGVVMPEGWVGPKSLFGDDFGVDE